MIGEYKTLKRIDCLFRHWRSQEILSIQGLRPVRQIVYSVTETGRKDVYAGIEAGRKNYQCIGLRIMQGLGEYKVYVRK